jgi:hypothetical protein
MAALSPTEWLHFVPARALSLPSKAGDVVECVPFTP